MIIWTCVVSKRTNAVFAVSGSRIWIRLRIQAADSANAIKIESRKRKMTNKRQSWNDFSKRELEKLNRRKREKRSRKSEERRKNYWDKRRKRKGKSIWSKFMELMIPMSLRVSIAIRLIIIDNLSLLVTTRQVCRVRTCQVNQITLELPKFQIHHLILDQTSISPILKGTE